MSDGNGIRPGAEVDIVDGLSNGRTGKVVAFARLSEVGVKVFTVDVDGCRKREIREDFMRPRQDDARVDYDAHSTAERIVDLVSDNMPLAVEERVRKRIVDILSEPRADNGWRVLVNDDGEPYAVEKDTVRLAVDTEGAVQRPAQRPDTTQTIDTNELWALLLCSVRYAMGRQSYVVGEVCDLVRKHRVRLTDEQVGMIASEVSSELSFHARRGRFLGAEMDHREWQRLVTDLTAKEVK